ncbi:MAG: hypothetical protein H7A46_03170 [Verrucomicrobiales bacterium]|nr:hypothetical protein [Verrucomicrobiales bacterium]
MVTTSSARGQFIQSLAEQDALVAAGALAYFIGLGVLVTPKGIEGALVAVQFASGAMPFAEVERKSLVALREDWSKSYADLADQLTERRQRFDGFLDEARSRHGRQEAAWGETMKKAELELATITESVSEKCMTPGFTHASRLN